MEAEVNLEHWRYMTRWDIFREILDAAWVVFFLFMLGVCLGLLIDG